MKKTVELRSFDTEIQGDDTAIEGLLVPYDRYADIAGFRERFAKGAFREYLAAGGDVIYNYAHDRSAILGRRESGTLTIEERDSGLWGRVELPDTTLGRDIRVMVKRGDIRGHSIEFIPVDDGWELKDGIDHRTITRAHLPGVALVARPAYADTTAALRSRDEWHAALAARVATANAEATLRLLDLD